MHYYSDIQQDQAFYTQSALKRQSQRRNAKAFIKGAIYFWIVLLGIMLILVALHTFASQDSTLLIRAG